MSLRLRQAVPGRPSRHYPQNVSTVIGDAEVYILYTSSSNVVLLNPQLELRETLLFWSALRHRASSSTLPDVQGVLGIEKDGLIIAWSGKHIVLWNFVEVRGRSTWAVHSTLVVSAQIKSIDYRKGHLIAATINGIESWKTDPTADIIVWDRLWDRPYGDAHSITLSPTLQHVAWFSAGQRSVLVLSVDRKGKPAAIPQEIRHPRPLSWIGWRCVASASADDFLYTISENQIFRVYSSVLDDPSWFQLLSTLDSTSFAPRSPVPINSRAKAPASATQPKGVLIPFDSDTVRRAVAAEKRHAQSKGSHSGDLQEKLQSLDGEEADVVLWLGQDGSVVLRSIVNIDRKPPTLLKSLPLARTNISPPQIGLNSWTSNTKIVLDPSSSYLLAVLPTSEDRRTIAAHRISLGDLLSSKPKSIVPIGQDASEEETVQVELEHNIDYFVRTPNGRGLLALTESGEVGVWYKERIGKVARDGPVPRAIIGKGQWTEPSRPKASAIFAKGRAIVFYTVDNGGVGKITLQHLDHDASSPTPPVTLSDFELDLGDDIAMLLAVSDIDDGFAGRGRRTQRAIVMAASRQGHAWVWRVDSRLVSTMSEDTTVDETPEITLLSHYTLPIEGGEPHLILPVDPMGWHQSVIDWKSMTPLQDMILTVSKSGVLEFWSPELGHHFKGEVPRCERKGGRDQGLSPPAEAEMPWRKTGVVRTGRKNASSARCSSRKKTVLICRNEQGEQEMTIWDSNVSEFSTGLELTHVFESEQVIQDLDWTTTSDLQSVLAVGFPHQVVLVCEQRLSYTEATPGWAPFLTLNLEQHTSTPISDSIWLAGGSLAIGAGNQIYLFSRFLDKASPAATPRGSIKSVAFDAADAEDIFQLIAWQNGPLFDFHPTVLAQSLLWDKMNLVKGIIVDLAKSLRIAEEDGAKRIDARRRDPSDFWKTSGSSHIQSRAAARGHEGLFDLGPVKMEEEEEDFPPRMVDDLVQRLHGPAPLPLSHSEKLQLASVARAVLEAERQRRSLDKCGLRYLISMRMAVNNSTRRAEVNGSTNEALRISFRNFVWATHSESQDLLLSAATECCENGKMIWEDAKRLGVFLWLKSSETLKSHLEIVARNRFMADEDRDPTKCSLVFFALGKKKVVHGLWKQAPGHKEQSLMLKFLSNDFELERWKTAAVKNAYALLSKQRYEFAAAMFMLGGSPKDAITVCLRQMNDWQLGYALARAVEGGTDGPIARWILTDTVVPLAMTGGHRWLATWAFWMLGRRDLAVRVLISPMDDVASAWTSDNPLPVGNPENDDPSLLLLFQHLKSKSLQTAKGTSEVPEKTEFDFVLHNARVFFRMGCHSLGLDLLRSWSFERPFFPPTKPKSSKATTPFINGSQTPLNVNIPSDTGRTRRPSLSAIPPYMRPAPRRPSFMLSGHARRESMVMDMDVFIEGASEAPTRVPSPQAVEVLDEKLEDAISAVQEDKADSADNDTEIKEEPPRKMGNLMKELKQDVQQGAMEFDMNSFF